MTTPTSDWRANAALINEAFSQRQQLDRQQLEDLAGSAIRDTLEALDQGTLRVASRQNDGSWQTHAWIKAAILLSFRLRQPELTHAGNSTRYCDLVPSKYANHTPDDFQRERVRVVPPAIARHGAYIAPDCVLMPSYINIGAYIGSGTLIDTWATVGSCAQIGERVHLSGGAGIGGVLEPAQAQPTIVEDDCFIGARCEIAEGVVVRQGAVIASGTFITQSTKIYDRETGQISHGEIPAYAVVVPGSLPATDGSHSVAAAIIVKRVDAGTRAKTGINTLLREAFSAPTQPHKLRLPFE